MSIRIVRNEQGNCINFYGSSNPTYWNACLSAEVDPKVTDSVNVINDIITSQTGVTKYEFYQIPYTEFADKEGNGFSTPQDAADYITANANVIGLGGGGTDLNGVTVCFRLDDTSTSIMLDNGYSYGVNTIKAIPDADGTVHITSKLGNITHFTGLEVGNVCVNDVVVSGGLYDIVNTLNELFTVGAFTEVVISDPFSTMIADVDGVDAGYTLVGSTVVDPAGDDLATNSTSGNYAGVLSTETINQAGEYFTFDIRGEGQIGFGLVHTTDSFNNGHYSGSANYADPATFAVSNSAHYGFQFSHWFHPTPNGSWTNYGANTSYIMGSGWSNWESKDEWLAGTNVKIRVGIDENGYIAISSLQDDDVTWVLHARTSYPVSDGSEYKLGIKFANAAPRLYTAPKAHLLEETAPTMNFRYIESPDGVYHFPIFSTAEEADYYDLNHNGTVGTGTHSTQVFPDDPSLSTWYVPTTGYTNDGSAAPVAETFVGNQVIYTEITSLTDAALAPVAFTDSTLTVDEFSTVNYQTQPQDTDYVTTFNNLPSSLSSLGAGTINGSAPEVTGDYVANPSDVYVIDVIRTNSYGSSTGTLTITVNNLTAPVDPISGYSHVSGTTAMVDSDTMGDGSVVHINNTVADGERFVIEAAYVEANILPSLSEYGDTYIIGLHNTAYDFSTLELSDFDAAIAWEYESATSHTFKFYRDGSVVQNIVINSLTQAFYDYAIEVDGTSAWLIACNLNSIMNEPSPSEGGSFSHTYEVTNTEDVAPLQIHFAALNTTGDISTNNLETLTVPAAPTGPITDWNKALDFNGSAERAQQVTSDSNRIPMKMGGTNNQVSAPTAGQTVSSGHPWATAVVFKSDTYNSNQHIWNLGEGAGTTDDNIYLRKDANRNLYFGWGRDGDMAECFVGTISDAIGGWHAVYIAHNGTRYGSNNTTSLMADAFDIRYTRAGNNWSVGSNVSSVFNWTITGDGRMNRQYQGDMTIGGRGANRNFRGKVASFVSTTLSVGVAMPSDAEIYEMITDPMDWLTNYKVGQNFRLPWGTSNAGFNFSMNDGSSAYSTQVWLMGDGTNDSYSNMIRNQVQPSDQNYTKLNLISMVSNDIETVNINGLT